MIIATAIFALAFVALTAIYVGVTNSQSKSKAKAVVLNETQIVFEQVARDIREHTVTTDSNVCNCSGLADSQFICLTDLANNYVFYRYNETAQQLEFHRNGVSCEAGTFIPLSDPNLEIMDFQFLQATPALASAEPGQSLTTLALKAKNRGGEGKKEAIINLQTTISSRLYGPN